MLKNRLSKYNVVFTPEPEGGFTVVVPSLPGCVTYGKDIEQATEMAKDAIKLYLESLKNHDEEIPSDEKSLIGSLDMEYPFSNA
jgi:antitoxin HicB